MTGYIAPWLIVKYLYIADAVDTEDAYTLLVDVSFKVLLSIIWL